MVDEFAQSPIVVATALSPLMRSGNLDMLANTITQHRELALTCGHAGSITQQARGATVERGILDTFATPPALHI